MKSLACSISLVESSFRDSAALSLTSSSTSCRHLSSKILILFVIDSLPMSANLDKAITADERTIEFSRTTRLYMCLIYRVGFDVFGPSSPKRCKTLTASSVYSQSSMNSHSISKASSLDCGMNLMMSKIASMMAFLKLNPPSSLSTSFKKFSIDWCLSGNLSDSVFMASMTIILNSSEMSSMNPPIVLTSLSTFSELPVLSSVVIA
ncbi:hypothetical protein OGATHE_003420 [Ogataea polymorpha]|uniref:Uncharacterized protein n=1 Tax=Ogataea polymorpha TaxID=460523 RepID=A0A9P8P3K4_9ASCO|nr:hypothetical protein OGATHE_003420 [Ogataea polymorpha]